MYSGVDVDNIVKELKNLPVETLEKYFDMVHGYEASEETAMHVFMVYEFEHIANVLRTINDECLQKLRVGSVLKDTYMLEYVVVSRIETKNGKITEIYIINKNGFDDYIDIDNIYIEGGSHCKDNCQLELTDEFIDINSILNKLKELEDKDI